MNWEAIGSIGEIVGAAGVIFTLAFLAIQIRQNTSSIKTQSEIEMSFKIAEWHGRVSINPELSKIYDDAIRDPESMSDGDVGRFIWFMAELYYIYEGCYFLYRKGDISKDSWNTKMDAAKTLLEIPHLQKWWDSRATPLTPEFVDHIDSIRDGDSFWTLQSQEEFLGKSE
ncbi:MAG: ribosomal protein S19 [Pseudohongiellaceae bacterium]|jgi:ribosomal protein S19